MSWFVTNLLALSPFHFIVLALACLCITQVVVERSLFKNIRNRVWNAFPPSNSFMDGGPDERPKRAKIAVYQNTGRGVDQRWYVEDGTKIGDLISCPYCFGFWVSLVGVLVVGLVPKAIALCFPFAIAYAVGFIAGKE